MPAGLDGNPNPLVTDTRTEVLEAVAALVLRIDGERVLVGVDGQSGAGKSTFADELAARLRRSGTQIIRSTTDSFHQPRSHRMRLGPASAEGFYQDSHQLDVIANELLHPFANGAGRVRVAAFDEPTDAPVDAFAEVENGERTVLIFDGLFLQRPELEALWDSTIFLDANERRDREWLDFLLADLPEAVTARADALDARLERARWPRYRAGWQGYIAEFDPAGRASIVIDNNDLGSPRLIRRAATSS